MNFAELIVVIIVWSAVGLFSALTLLMVIDYFVYRKTGSGLPIFKNAIWNPNENEEGAK